MKSAVLLVVAGMSAVAGAQGRVVAGYVAVGEANATGVLMVSGGRNVLGGASVVTAGERPAHVELGRGGSVKICGTSTLHLTTGARGSSGNETLLIALDRGAMEIATEMGAGDAVMTPDLRFVSAEAKGRPLDLALRVTPNGDTCVENRGKGAPALNIAEAFGAATYQLRAGQHVLFEHGSLRQVVDRESGACGCPPEGAAGEVNPFPLAVSEGLAPSGVIVPEAPGGTHVQVADTFSHDADAPVRGAAAVAGGKEKKGGAMRAIGRFFRRLFVR